MMNRRVGKGGRGVEVVAQRRSAAPTAALMARRFRGFLPVAIDVETGGFHCSTDALLEIARNFAEIRNEKHQEAVSQLARALASR